MAAKKASKKRKANVPSVVEKLVPHNLDFKGARKKILTIEKKLEKKVTAALKPLKSISKRVKLSLGESSTTSASKTSRTRTKLRTRSAPRRKAARRA